MHQLSRERVFPAEDYNSAYWLFLPGKGSRNIVKETALYCPLLQGSEFIAKPRQGIDLQKKGSYFLVAGPWCFRTKEEQLSQVHRLALCKGLGCWWRGRSELPAIPVPASGFRRIPVHRLHVGKACHFHETVRKEELPGRSVGLFIRVCLRSAQI